MSETFQRRATEPPRKIKEKREWLSVSLIRPAGATWADTIRIFRNLISRRLGVSALKGL
jgi:hypothetical protein